MNKLTRFAGYGVLFLLIGLVGAMDYEDEVEQQSSYCNHVGDKRYPDYNMNYNDICVNHIKSR